MNDLDKQYTTLLKDILDNGHQKGDRTGTGTISVFGRQIRHKMSDGFPLLTTKKMYWSGIVTELIWFLRGDTNIKFLVDNNCHIWDGDTYKKYYNDKDTFGPLTMAQFIEEIKTNDEFTKKWGDLGPVYGKQWRNWKHMGPKSQQEMLDENTNWPWKTTEIDQITNLINDLKTNPDSRRLMVNAWNVGELDSMVLPPCHYGFQVYTRELSLEERDVIFARRTFISTKGSFAEQNGTLADYLDKEGIPTRAISLMWNQRSVDTFLGLPFNIASYGLLLEIIAKVVNMVPDQLIGNLGDTHLYSNHIEQAKEQIGREPYPLPTLNINTEFWPYEGGECGVGPLDAIGVIKAFSDENFCRCLLEEDIQLVNYKSHPAIKAQLSN
jgi:thymidylate synthase